jgi:hypothetical protein
VLVCGNRIISEVNDSEETGEQMPALVVEQQLQAAHHLVIAAVAAPGVAVPVIGRSVAVQTDADSNVEFPEDIHDRR